MKKLLVLNVCGRQAISHTSFAWQSFQPLRDIHERSFQDQRSTKYDSNLLNFQLISYSRLYAQKIVVNNTIENDLI